MAQWLVTGGCGFIGSHLVERLLARGDKVRIIDDLLTGRRHDVIEPAELRIGDVADPELLGRGMDGVDGCFHLAAVSSVQRCTEHPLATHRTNQSATLTVFDMAKRLRPLSPIPVVYASSAAVYGDNPDLPLCESATAQPISAYGADKLGCELHARVAWLVHKVPNVGLRFFNVYGPRQDPGSPYSGVISIFVDRIANSREVPIFGDGHQSRDFVYVGDVVAHLVAAMEKASGGTAIFNVCTGRLTTVLELAEAIGGILRREVRRVHLPARPGDIRVSAGDPAKAEAAFGFTSRTMIDEGLRQTLRAISASVTV